MPEEQKSTSKSAIRQPSKTQTGKSSAKSNTSGNRGASTSPKKKTKSGDRDCIENIVIPPQLPQILKLYTKAAMRTQPNDLLRWTHTYMKAMRDGQTPPVKDRGEPEPLEKSPTGLTPGFLRVLNNMVS